MLHTRRARTHAAAGFTFVELVAVIVLIGILSVAAIPAIGVIGKAHKAALTQEVQRQLALVRERAIATGEPSGVTFDLPLGALSMIRLVSGQTIATPMPGVTGEPTPSLSVASAFPGASIDSVVNGDGASGTGSIWFDAEGTPQVYLGSGSFSTFTQSAVVSISGGYSVTVFQQTGGIQ